MRRAFGMFTPPFGFNLFASHGLIGTPEDVGDNGRQPANGSPRYQSAAVTRVPHGGKI